MSNDHRSTSRRTFLRSGAASAGMLIGPSGVGRASPPSKATGEPDGTDSTPIAEGVMFPYQVVAGRRATVVETDLDWRPTGLESGYRTHVIAYDHAPSLRAFFFAREARSLEESFELESITGTSTAAGERFVDVDIDPVRT